MGKEISLIVDDVTKCNSFNEFAAVLRKLDIVKDMYAYYASASNSKWFEDTEEQPLILPWMYDEHFHVEVWTEKGSGYYE